MGQVGVVRSGKGEFQHLHTRQAGGIPQVVDRVGQQPQVLGDVGDIGEPAGQNAQQVHPRALLPLAHLGGVGLRRDGPVALQAPEVVDADGVKQLGGALHPANPPTEAVPLHGGPVVQRVAPQLAVLGEVVRRHARHLGGLPLPVQQKLLPFRPHVGGVQGHIDGQVADDLDAQAVGVLLQGFPLGEEPVLDIGVEGDLFSQFLPPALHSGALVAAQGFVRPVVPGLSVKMGLGGPVQCVFSRPGITLCKRPNLFVLLALCPSESLAQQGLPGLVECVVFDLVPGRDFGGGQIAPVQQAVRRQQVQIDEQRVAGEGGHAGVGGVPLPRGAHGQNLPPGLSGGVEEIGKGPGLLAQGADAVV